MGEQVMASVSLDTLFRLQANGLTEGGVYQASKLIENPADFG